MLNMKRFVLVKEHVTPTALQISHHRFWAYVKDKALRVLWEDKESVCVRDDDGEQHTISKQLVEPLNRKEVARA